jgi:diacylglycerol kinase family enzyme
MRLHFLVNPHAGRGCSADRIAAIRRACPADELTLSSDLRREEIPRDVDRIVAVGGDGTVNRAIAVCIETGNVLGIVPRGSANDLARQLGLPRDLAAACAAIRSGAIARLDLPTVNGIAFGTCGGIGLGAAVALRANLWRAPGAPARRLGALLGRRIYPLAALAELARGWQPFRACLTLSGNTRETDCAALLVGTQAGCGGFRFSPGTRQQTGLLELCAIAAPPLPGRMAWISLQLLRGQAGSCREVSRYRAATVTIATERCLPFFGDGEILCRDRLFEVAVRRRSLRVAVPRGANRAAEPLSGKGGGHD